MIGHVDGGTMRLRPSSPSRVRRRRRAVAPVLQQPRRLLSVTGSTLAWAQRAAASSAAAPGVSLLAAATSVVASATEGVTASFIKELVRRATLVVLRGTAACGAPPGAFR
jgi:hypothetical protein